MKISKADLDRVAVMEEQYPKDDLPELALAGRSNVGKSSFINSMVNRKNLARTSSKPGKTRTINFYKINDSFRLVDLPGYGYARVSKEEKEKWAHIIEEYLNSRENLREVLLVIDMRHRPSKDDVLMYDWIKHFGFGQYVIATKADKIKKSQLDKHIKVIMEELGIERDQLIAYSSEKTKMDQDMWARIESIIK